MPSVSISMLISNLSMACRALVPALDAALVPWQEGKQYDNWERIEEVLFKSLVSEPCEYDVMQTGEEAKFGSYGFDKQDDDASAKLFVLPNGEEDVWRYVRLATRVSAFDAARCVRHGEIKTFLLLDVDVHLIVTSTSGETSRSDIRLNL